MKVILKEQYKHYKYIICKCKIILTLKIYAFYIFLLFNHTVFLSNENWLSFTYIIITNNNLLKMFKFRTK